jgi:hypothetical protein
LVLMQSHGIADACPTTVHACIWIMLDYHLLCIEKNITSASTMVRCYSITPKNDNDEDGLSSISSAYLLWKCTNRIGSFIDLFLSRYDMCDTGDFRFPLTTAGAAIDSSNRVIRWSSSLWTKNTWKHTSVVITIEAQIVSNLSSLRSMMWCLRTKAGERHTVAYDVMLWWCIDQQKSERILHSKNVKNDQRMTEARRLNLSHSKYATNVGEFYHIHDLEITTHDHKRMR